MRTLRTPDRMALAGLALLPVVWYATPIFTDACYYLGDLIAQYHPWWTYGHESLREGRVPLWNPYVLGGMPYHVNPENSLFYPLKLPLVFLSFFRAAALLRALDTIVAATGAFFLLRAWRMRPISATLGALMFSYGSFMAYEFIHIPYVNTAVWFPWQVACAERLVARPAATRALALAAVTACSFLGGSPGVFVIVQLSAGAFLAARLLRLVLARRMARLILLLGLLACAAAVVVALTAVLLWPAWEFVAQTPRAGGLTASPTFSDFAVTLDELRALAFPWLHLRYGAPYPPVYPILFLYVPYAGMAAVLLGLFSFRSRRRAHLLPPALCVATFGVLMSLGTRSSFFPWMLEQVPWLRWFRWPHDYLLMVYLVLWILAAAGFDALWRARGRRLRQFGPIVAAYFLAGLWLAPWTETVIAVLVASTIVVAGWLAARASWVRSRSAVLHRAAGAAAVALLLGDLAVYGSGLRTYLPREQVELREARDVAEWIRRHGPLDRVAFSAPSAGAHQLGRERVFGRHVPLVEDIPQANRSGTDQDRWLRGLDAPELASRLWARREAFADLDDVHWTYPVNAAMVLRYQEISGYDPFAIDRVLRLFRALPFDRTWDLFGVRWIVTPHRLVHERLEEAARVGALYVHRNTGALPRVSVPARASDGLSADETLARLGLASFDPRDEILLEERLSPPAEAQPAGTAGSAAIVSHEPERVVIRAELHRDGFLVLHDIFDPGWKVRVDGEPAPMLRADYVFRAVRLAAGSHEVEFVYRPRSFVLGAWVSGIAWLSLFPVLVLARRFRPAPARRPDRPPRRRTAVALWGAAAAFVAVCLWIAARTDASIDPGPRFAPDAGPVIVDGPRLIASLPPGRGWSPLADGVRLHEGLDVRFSAPIRDGGATSLWLVARGRPLYGVWPLVTLHVDGHERAAFHVTSADWGAYRTELDLPRGEHRFRLRFANDRARFPDDRDLDLQLVTVGDPASALWDAARWTAPVTVPSTRISELVFAEPRAGSLALWPHGRASDLVFVQRPSAIEISVRASSDDPSARLALTLDRTPVASIHANASAARSVVVRVEAGWHRFEISHPGPRGRSPVRVDALRFGGEVASGRPADDPLVLTRETHVARPLDLGVGSAAEVSHGAMRLLSSDRVRLPVLVPDPGSWRLSVRAGGEPCRGEGPRALLMADDDQLASWRFDSAERVDRSAELMLDEGLHEILLVYDNDLYVPGECDRNLVLEELRFEPVAGPG